MHDSIYSLFCKDGSLGDDLLGDVHCNDLTERAQMIDGGREWAPADEPLSSWINSHTADPLASTFSSLK